MENFWCTAVTQMFGRSTQFSFVLVLLMRQNEILR